MDITVCNISLKKEKQGLGLEILCVAWQHSNVQGKTTMIKYWLKLKNCCRLNRALVLSLKSEVFNGRYFAHLHT